jgi:DNA-binding MarR family transcriptional regulator
VELDLATALVRLAHVVDRVFVDAGRANDLTPQQAQLLCLLTDGPVGMAELARLLHLEKSSLTGLVDRVERRGLVDRVRDEADRRACRAALTAEGEKIAVATHREVTAMLDDLATELPAAERSRLAAGLSRMVAAHADH